MRFTFVTEYNQKALTAMARGLRKTVRSKRSKRSHILGVIVILLCVLLTLIKDQGFIFNLKNVVTWVAGFFVIAVLIWEDYLNGYFAGKKMLKGTEKNTAIFTEEGYSTLTAVGESSWVYNTLAAVAETRDYFVFVFSLNHAQVYDKNGMTEGTPEAFRRFIERKTGKTVQNIA